MLSYVCPRCASRLSRSSQRAAFSSSSRSRAAATAAAANPPAPPPASGHARLSNRSLLSVTGHDTTKFLHGLLTSSVSEPTPGGGFYSSFLTAQGRVLFDVFLYPLPQSSTSSSSPGSVAARAEESSGYIVEVDAAERDTLLRHLKRHKLRSKVKLRALEDGERGVYAVWHEGERWNAYGLGATQQQQQQAGRDAAADETLSLVDQRAPAMGRRVLVAPSSQSSVGMATFEDSEEASADQYRIRRYLKGVPEGQAEIQREQTLPMAANLDLMGAIDFKKGCYVGQELTIRTHHTGVVRRRMLPVQLYQGNTPPEKEGYDPDWSGGTPRAEDEIALLGKKGKPGRWIAGVGNVGLAVCRLEMMTDLAVTNESGTFDAEDRFVMPVDGAEPVGVKAFVPDWMRGKIRAPKVQKRVA